MAGKNHPMSAVIRGEMTVAEAAKAYYSSSGTPIAAVPDEQSESTEPDKVAPLRKPTPAEVMNALMRGQHDDPPEAA